MQAVILAGGLGTRLGKLTKNTPKPMVYILGKPILQYQIENLRNQGITEIILIICYKGNVIKNYFGDGSNFGVNITYFEESKPLGTAGSLFKLKLKDTFILINGDLYFDINLSNAIKFHKDKSSYLTIISHPNNHPYDSCLIKTKIEYPDEIHEMPIDTNIIDIYGKPKELYYKNLCNSGISIIEPKALNTIRNKLKTDFVNFDSFVINNLLYTNKVYSYKTTEYIKDLGTKKRINQFKKDFKKGIPNKRNLSNKQKAIFLDRDGIINKYVGYVNTLEKFKLRFLIDNVIKKINSSEYLVVIITNQPIIARGESSFENLNNIHNKMETCLGKKGAYLDGIYFCPHHPSFGFFREIKRYKKQCSCRKPNIGLLYQAAQELNIDINKSYFIGDTTVDLQTGINANCKKSFKIKNIFLLNYIINRLI